MPTAQCAAAVRTVGLYAYFHSAWRGELRTLAEIVKNCEKGILREFKVIQASQGHRICHQSKRHILLTISG